MNFNHFFNSQTKSVGGAAGILAISAIISGILGLLRDRFLVAVFGASIETSTYLAAFRIPDFVYQILISGGIVFVFLPLFAEYFSKSQEKAWEMTNYVLNVFLFLLILISLILFIFTPWLIKFIIPGFTPETKATAIILTRLLFLSPILLGVSNIFSGVLQYFHRFLSYSLAPIFYNLGIIFGILVLSPYFGIFGVGLGVILGAFSHLLIQIPPAFGCGFRYKFLFDFKYPAIKRTFILMIPRIFGIVASQINLIILTAIASTIAVGSITVFTLSNNLQGLPVTILGISLATAIFPTFSRLWVNGQKTEFIERFSSLLRQTLFLVIPISILMFLLRVQIVRIIFGTGRFGWEETRLTAASLGIFCLSISASSLIPFVARAFFSFQDTKTPALITFITVTINAFFSFLFVWLLGFPNIFSVFIENTLKLKGIENMAIVGLPLAFSVATISQIIFLLFFLYRRIGNFGIKEILSSFKKILIASLLMGVFAYQTLQIVANFVDMNTFLGIFSQAITAGVVGIFIYLLATFLLKSPELQIVKSLILNGLSKVNAKH